MDDNDDVMDSIMNTNSINYSTKSCTVEGAVVFLRSQGLSTKALEGRTEDITFYSFQLDQNREITFCPYFFFIKTLTPDEIIHVELTEPNLTFPTFPPTTSSSTQNTHQSRHNNSKKHKKHSKTRHTQYANTIDEDDVSDDDEDEDEFEAAADDVSDDDDSAATTSSSEEEEEEDGDVTANSSSRSHALTRSAPARGAGTTVVKKKTEYSVGADTFMVSRTQVSSSALRDHLMASDATMARLLREGGAGGASQRSESGAAVKALRLLKEFFHEIPSYKYEFGRSSHQWEKVKGLDAKLLTDLASEAGTIMAAEPTLLRLDPPVYVIGDLHGNFKDFSYFAKAFGLWSSAEFIPVKFLFLGDYVDRGLHSIETLAFVLALKIRFPNKVFLLRGNHECAEINGDEDIYQSGSFKYQLKLTYGAKEGIRLWQAFNACFDQMPLAAVIDNKIFCVHAGIPRFVARCPECDILDAIATIPRPPNINDDLVFDLIWSDPATAAEERYLGCEGFPQGFGPNARGPATCVFGKQAVELFCRNSGCSHLIRAHQSPKLGVEIAKNATILTVFSSSHYCGAFNRAASVLVHDHKLDVIVSNPSTDADSPDVFPMNEDYVNY